MSPQLFCIQESGDRIRRGASLIDCRSLAFVIVGASTEASDLKSSVSRGNVSWKVGIYMKATGEYCLNGKKVFICMHANGES